MDIEEGPFETLGIVEVTMDNDEVDMNNTAFAKHNVNENQR